MSITLDKRQLHDTHCMIQGISWTQFENIELAFSGVAGVRFVYLDGILEIMTLSPEHEDIKSTIGLLLESYLRQVGPCFYKRGSATLGSQALGGRKEPDESYNLIVKKSIPDLVIEVILTSGSINLLDFYHRIGVPEVWYWEDVDLQVYYLSASNQDYEASKQSKLFPDLNISILSRYITYHDQYDAVAEFIKEISK